MSLYTVDTSAIISRKLLDLPNNFLFSSVVLMELMASASDESRRRTYENIYRSYQKDDALIVPETEDWLMTSKVLFWLTKGRRKSTKGKTPRLRPGATQRMAMDVMLAVSARRWRTTVITENWDDFKAIQNYCDVKIVRASGFFG